MWQQKSYNEQRKGGMLYLVPTPIGNLEDMTFRAIRLLKEADYIAAEDTRQTKKLCNHFEIDTSIVSYHEHNKESKGKQILSDLEAGKIIALVSDAGMPTISDPGYELVVLASQNQHHVVPLPGANAALTSLIASGLPTSNFMFYGFLPRHKKQKKEQLAQLKKIKATLIFYEAPHRLKETLQLMLEALGNRPIAVTRELTKRYEEFIRGNLEEMLEWANKEEIRGEFCLIVQGNEGEDEEEQEYIWWEQLNVIEHVNFYIEEKGMNNKDSIKQAAKDRNVSKRDIYNEYHKNV
ncbi:16S rRNA (cytidine(1402)-2'-O)-methyltransferase [Priestia abyssalis]|uniref:16S rRNA (cytidine(1402)-2'-O)-methyltransferase n=1 Tax=Priestia abyssalis TaxID=1221450 RepID=UPI0009952634|nr:16S rRNA (cytidine(1402)-2'-O)-methyltransferase [Priestia abyssalis]